MEKNDNKTGASLEDNNAPQAESGKETLPDNPNNQSVKAFKDRYKYFIPPWLFLVLFIFLVTCSKDQGNNNANVSLLKQFPKEEQYKIVTIGKVIEGVPYLDASLTNNIIKGILKENQTYQLLFPEGTIYYFDEESLNMHTQEVGSGVFFLTIRGIAFFEDKETHFIVAYEITTEQDKIPNVSQNQDVCSGSPCTYCAFLYSGNEIVGCDECPDPDPDSKCNHMNSEFARGSYLIIPIEL